MGMNNNRDDLVDPVKKRMMERISLLEKVIKILHHKTGISRLTNEDIKKYAHLGQPQVIPSSDKDWQEVIDLKI